MCVCQFKYIDSVLVFITVIEMCRWRKSEEEPEGHSAMSATTK